MLTKISQQHNPICFIDLYKMFLVLICNFLSSLVFDEQFVVSVCHLML